MKTKLLVAAAAMTVAAFPAYGAVTVLGSSYARSCFEAADADGIPDREAIESCNEALTTEALDVEDRVATYVNRGILRSRLTDYAAALADFDAALALDANQPEAYLNKGVVLIRQENADAALPLFTMALQKNTRRPELAYYARGVAHEDLGNLSSAYADYKRAAAQAPKWKAPRTDLARFAVRK